MKVMRTYKSFICAILSFLSISALFYAVLNYTVIEDTPIIDDFLVRVGIRTRSMMPYHFFDDRHIYSVATKPIAVQTSADIKMTGNAKILAAKYLNTSIRLFKFGQYRLLENGIEFDFYFSNSDSMDLRQIKLLFPLSSPQIIFDQEPTGELPETVHMIMPLKGRMEALEIFADNIVHYIYPTDSRITLTVVYFRDEVESEVRSILERKFADIPNFQWTFLVINDSTFSRGKGIQIGVEFLKMGEGAIKRPSSDLLFICDVDIIIKQNFIRRCRSNSIRGRQVYFPIVFSLYNPDLVYGPRGPNAAPIIKVEKDNGFWRNFGYGMVCLYKEDFDSAGGLPDYKEWGREDLALFEKISKSKSIEYIRVPDPDIYHIYHHKDCRNVSPSIKMSCIKSKILTEGSQLQMGFALFNMTENIDKSNMHHG